MSIWLLKVNSRQYLHLRYTSARPGDVTDLTKNQSMGCRVPSMDTAWFKLTGWHGVIYFRLHKKTKQKKQIWRRKLSQMSAGQKRVQFSIQHYPPETKRWPKIICCLKIWAVSARNSRRDTTGLWCKQFFIFHVVKLCAYYPCGCLASSRSI